MAHDETSMDVATHKFVNEVTDKVAALLNNEFQAHNATVALSVHTACAVAARIASSSLIGNLTDEALASDTDYTNMVEAFIHLFRGNCELVRRARLADGDKMTTSAAPASAPTSDPWDQ